MSLLCLFFENFCSTKHSTYNKNSARFLSLFLTHQKLLRIVDFFLTKICRFTCQLGVQSYTKMETQNLVKILFLTQKPQKWQKWKIQFLHIVSKLTKLSAYLNFPDKNKMSNIWNFAPKMTNVTLPHYNEKKKKKNCPDFFTALKVTFLLLHSKLTKLIKNMNISYNRMQRSPVTKGVL